jgi:hypothetical protein
MLYHQICKLYNWNRIKLLYFLVKITQYSYIEILHY